jgi:hypothetical protein
MAVEKFNRGWSSPSSPLPPVQKAVLETRYVAVHQKFQIPGMGMVIRFEFFTLFAHFLLLAFYTGPVHKPR